MADDEMQKTDDHHDHLEMEDDQSAPNNLQENSENVDDIYAQLAQKDRDLVLAAELGKALLDSNQELQGRYDQLMEDFNSKVESLQQEKYALHLDVEKLETEHLNKVKDLQDDISAVRKQLLETSQNKHASETDKNRCMEEAQRKSEYLADQIQQVCKKEEELLEKLDEERERNKSNELVIQDHADHIDMLREQVEYLTEKLREANEALTSAEQEKALLVRQEISLKKQLRSYESNEKQKKTNHKNKQLPSHRQLPSSTSSSQTHQPGSCKTRTTVADEQRVPLTEGLHRYKGMSFSDFHPTSHFKPVEIPCRTGELTNSDRTSPTSNFDPGTTNVIGQRSPQSITGNSMLTEFSSIKYRHTRNRSDCSISSMTEGSRKRHYETIGLSSDEEANPDRNFKSANCKQSLLSKLIDSTNAKMIERTKTHDSDGGGGDDDDEDVDDDLESSISSGSPPVGSILEESRESGFSQAMSMTSGAESTSAISTLPQDFPDTVSVASSASDYPWASKSHTYLPHCDSPILGSPHSAHPPREMSLFDELSCHGIGLDRQDSGNSEKSLFDELSGHMRSGNYTEEDSDFPSSCLHGHPDFNSHSDWLDAELSIKHNGQRVTDSKQSDSDSNYTSEWPLLSSVSADMLDEDDDFECDDDDFLVGNIAGSTLSIGDSGVGPMLKSFHSSLDAEPSDMSDPWQDAKDKRWADKIKGDKNQQCFKEACKQLRQLVVRLGGGIGDSFQKEPVGPSGDYDGEADFDHLLSLVQELRTCVDQLDHTKISSWRTKTHNQQWLSKESDYHNSLAGLLRRRSEHFVGCKDLRKSISSSPLLVRRSL